MRIVPIGSGKGGVGKSVIATNLSIALSEAGLKVILVDLDLGGSNIHTILGFRSIERGIGTFLNDRKARLNDIILDTAYDGLFFIPGDAEIPGIANLKSYQKQRLIKNIYTLEADFVVLDLGAGTNYNVMDFFLMSGSGIVVTNPTLTAILNAYLFIKNVIFRLMDSAFGKKTEAYKYIEKLKREGSPLQRVYIPKLLSEIAKIDPESHRKFVHLTENLKPNLILNMIDDPKDSDKALKLRRSTREYLGIDLEHLGVVYRDNLQDIALSSRLPIIKYKPNSVISQAIYRIADKLVQTGGDDSSPIDVMTIDESYQVAEIEAETDFQVKIHNMEELLHSGALTMGDLVETIRSQQFEIQNLKKENQLLKTKLAEAVREGFRV